MEELFDLLLMVTIDDKLVWYQEPGIAYSTYIKGRKLYIALSNRDFCIVSGGL